MDSRDPECEVEREVFPLLEGEWGGNQPNTAAATLSQCFPGEACETFLLHQVALSEESSECPSACRGRMSPRSSSSSSSPSTGSSSLSPPAAVAPSSASSFEDSPLQAHADPHGDIPLYALRDAEAPALKRRRLMGKQPDPDISTTPLVRAFLEKWPRLGGQARLSITRAWASHGLKMKRYCLPEGIKFDTGRNNIAAQEWEKEKVYLRAAWWEAMSRGERPEYALLEQKTMDEISRKTDKTAGMPDMKSRGLQFTFNGDWGQDRDDVREACRRSRNMHEKVRTSRSFPTTSVCWRIWWRNAGERFFSARGSRTFRLQWSCPPTARIQRGSTCTCSCPP